MSDSLQPHGLESSRLLCPWDFPGKNTGVGCHFLFQEIFMAQGSNPCTPAPAGDFFTTEPPGKRPSGPPYTVHGKKGGAKKDSKDLDWSNWKDLSALSSKTGRGAGRVDVGARAGVRS